FEIPDEGPETPRVLASTPAPHTGGPHARHDLVLADVDPRAPFQHHIHGRSPLAASSQRVGQGQPIYDAVKRARSNNPWCREGPWRSLSNGFGHTKRERAQPHPTRFSSPAADPSMTSQ